MIVAETVRVVVVNVADVAAVNVAPIDTILLQCRCNSSLLPLYRNSICRSCSRLNPSLLSHGNRHPFDVAASVDAVSCDTIYANSPLHSNVVAVENVAAADVVCVFEIALIWSLYASVVAVAVAVAEQMSEIVSVTLDCDNVRS